MSAPKGNRFNRLWETPKDLEKDVKKYFAVCKKDNRPLTITGLALYLKTSRQTLINYEKELGKDFDAIIKEAKLRCENYAEEELYRKGGQVAGIIFNLKNNYKGWKEKREIAIGGLKSLLDEVYEGKQSNIKSESGNPEPVDRKDEGQTL